MHQIDVPPRPDARAATPDRGRLLRWAIPLLLAVGLALRLTWVLHGRLKPTPSEMFNISRAFATTGRLADAYGPGRGSTAHALPVTPWISGTVYRLLGVGTQPAELALSFLALAFVGISFLALNEAFRSLQVPRFARLGALAILALAPLNFALETVEFRVWEGGEAAAGLALVLWAVLEFDAAETRVSWMSLALLAAASAFLAMISQATALAGFGLVGLLSFRQRGIRGLAGAAALCALFLAAVSLPWALRNQAVLGEMIWSRTNFGFNLAIGFHDGALHPADPRAAFLDRLRAVDPYQSPEALKQLKAIGGEAAYSRLWTARTIAWIEQHPFDALQLAVRHFVDFYFPARWEWNVYSDRGQGAGLKQALLWAMSLLAFCSLAARITARDWRYLYVATALALVAAPYVLVQPVLRYRYPIVGVLVFLTVDVLCRAAAALLKRRNAGG